MIVSPLLDVSELRIAFRSEKIFKEVVHSINFSVTSNDVLGLVGESGSGKSIASVNVLLTRFWLSE